MGKDGFRYKVVLGGQGSSRLKIGLGWSQVQMGLGGPGYSKT